MFGKDAPVWQFLTQFGGPADPLEPLLGTRVVETYPVLAMIALGWTLPDPRPAGRLPKYNPERKTFSNSDWKHVCQQTSTAFLERGLRGVVRWLDDAAEITKPRKSHQDGLDACICLLAAMYMAERRECLMVGNQETGYIVVPYGEGLHDELNARCEKTDRKPSEWVRSFQLRTATPSAIGSAL
jgi:predicted RNase H-like nuclease